MNFLITRRSVDSTLVSSHDYVSCLTTALEGLISAELQFSVIIYLGGFGLVHLAAPLRAAESFTWL